MEEHGRASKGKPLIDPTSKIPRGFAIPKPRDEASW